MYTLYNSFCNLVYENIEVIVAATPDKYCRLQFRNKLIIKPTRMKIVKELWLQILMYNAVCDSITNKFQQINHIKNTYWSLVYENCKVILVPTPNAQCRFRFYKNWVKTRLNIKNITKCIFLFLLYNKERTTSQKYYAYWNLMYENW